MKKIKYSSGETIYLETLENSLKVFLYPTTKTKNFYITASTFFGAEVMKYKKGDKTYDVTLGSAHFLEHRVMDFTKNKEAMEKLNNYGSLVNAYTTYKGTNYNIFGHEKILDNIEMLFDRVFHANIREEDVENERGIILEEYYMCQSDPFYILETNTLSNAFNSSFIKYPVIGSVNGIKTVTTKELNRLYKDFYTPDNMFVVVCGNFDKDEILDFIREYTKKLKPSKEKIKVVKTKENLSIDKAYEEINLGMSESKVALLYKTDMKKGVDKERYRVVLDFALKEIFSKTGEAFLELSKNGIQNYNYSIEEVDDLNAIYFKASTDKIELFKKIVEKYLKKLKLDSDALERKKRGFLKPFILSFEDITIVEDNITSDMFYFKKLINNRDTIINSITLKEANNYLKDLDISNNTTLVIK